MALVKRTAFQGVLNIVKFNWHIYAMALAAWIVAAVLMLSFPSLSLIMAIFLLVSSISIITSLLISYHIYDKSQLYELPWTHALVTAPLSIINIHAGFDEMSTVLQSRFPESNLQVFDFYDPLLHTEISVKRARLAYPAYPGTYPISTKEGLPTGANADLLCLLFSAHEIRDTSERIHFFASLKKHVSKGGTLVVMEHLRDLPNIFAYNIGAMHFFSEITWLDCFKAAGWNIARSQKITAFVHVYLLKCHD